VYSTHVVKKKPKHWTRVITPGPNYLAHVDSAHFDFKGAFKYFIVMIDVFSRKLAARAVSDLKATTANTAIQSMLDELHNFEYLRMDFGKEYKNRLVTSALRARKINYMYSYPPMKSNYAERVIRTLKARLYRVMQRKGDDDWAKFLPKVVKAYNNRKHTSLGISPNEVTEANTAALWFKFKKKNLRTMPRPQAYKFDINDGVRVNFVRKAFDKEYFEQNSPAVYFISTRYNRGNVHRYRLKTDRNHPLDGTFLADQLQRARVNNETEYRIDHVIRYRRINGVLHAYVKWRGYDNSYNSYIPAAHVVDLPSRT